MRNFARTVGAAIAMLCVAGGVAFLSNARRERAEAAAADILLFAGTGTSRNDVAAIRALLDAENLSYRLVDSRGLDALSAERLRTFDLLIVPGGNFEHIGQGLATGTPARIRQAVHGGLNYLGICAGAFIAGDSPYNGINLTGNRFAFHRDSHRGIRKQPMLLLRSDGKRLVTYWEDGPQLSGWGDPVAAYSDGSPAVAQGKVGSGWVVLSGVHLEAPDDWYEGMELQGPTGPGRTYAVELIQAALTGQALPGRPVE